MTTPHYSDDRVTVHHGDCLDVLAEMPDNSVDAIVTDPPYGLGFMGKAWDDLPPGLPWAQECLRVLKPGGHLLAFGGTRTWHRLAVAVEDAGFEMRDSIAWLYASGFPKSLNVGKGARFCQCQAVPYSHADADLPGVRDTVPSTAPDGSSGAVADLLASVQREGAGAGVGDTRPQGASSAEDAHATTRSAEPSLERRGDVQAGTRELRGTSLRPLSTGVRLDGPHGRVRGGTPAGDGAVDRSATDADRVRQPHQPRPAGQPQREPGPLADESGSQARGVRPVCAGCGKPRIPQGLGTALKPAFEPIVVARKPLQGTVAANVQQWGTGALNIDATRVGTGEGIASARGTRRSGGIMGASELLGGWAPTPGQGRWPTNVALDSDMAAELDEQSGTLKSGGGDRGATVG